MMETTLAQHTSNDSKVFDEAYFQANQELLVESIKLGMQNSSMVVNSNMHKHTATTTTLTSPILGDGTIYQISVADATGFTVGSYIHINTTSVETTHPMITATTAATGPAVLTLDRRLDSTHAIGDEVTIAILNIATTVGSLATPVEYYVGPPVGEIWHLERFLLSITHDTAGDLGKFGGITALTNGVLVRAKIANKYYTFTNWKSNGDMKTDMFDVVFDARSGGQGLYGTSAKGSFRDVDVTLELNGTNGDKLELYVQDSLVGILMFTMKVQGFKEII